MSAIFLVAVMVGCLAAIYVTTNGWLGELVASIAENDIPHPAWPILVIVCLASAVAFNITAAVLFL